MEKEKELKPCPFCGGEAEIKQYKRNGMKIKCTKCNVKIEQCVLRYSLEWLTEKMITDWNTRINP